MSEPLHLNKTHLSCNSEQCRAYPGTPKDELGNRLLDKHTETVTDEHEDIRCLYCGNWLCGLYDAFGDVSSESISIKRIHARAEEFA